MVFPRRWALLPAFIAIAFPFLVSAQALGTTDPLTLSIAPQYPAPYSQAVITPLSGTVDLSSVTFIVSVNGKQMYTGNAKAVPVVLGAAGTIANITATITGGGTNASQTAVIQPEDVALIAEPVSSAPVLYLGKPLIPLSGSVRMVAVANMRTAAGTALDPNTLSYSWTVDGTQVAGGSGIGKSSLIVSAPLQYRASNVSIVVSSPDGSLVGGDSFSLNPQEPTLRIYENDPLLGIRFDHSLSGSFSLTSAEDSLYGVPYSFPTSAGAPTLQWFLNGSAAQSGPSITLRPTGSGSGSANLSLTASAAGGSTASAILSVLFNSSTGTNVFGL